MTIDEKTVDLWEIPLVVSESDLNLCLQTLNGEEKQRAARYHRDKDRERFVIGRGALRAVLAGYLGERPERILFRYGHYGKPELPEGGAGMGLQFNLSHSNDLAVLAVTRTRAVGVDLEWIAKTPLDSMEVAEAFFAHSELRLLKAARTDEREEIFFRLWTQKEAVLKGLGLGLVGLANAVEVNLTQTEPVRLRRRIGHDRAWRTREFWIGSCYVGAVAVEGESACLRYRIMKRESCEPGMEVQTSTLRFLLQQNSYAIK